MNYPNRYIQTSDYGTLKNDSGITIVSATITNGQVFNPSNSLLAFSDFSVGTINAPIRAVGHNTKDNIWGVGSLLTTSINMQDTSGTYLRGVWAMVYRLNASTMRLAVYAESYTGGSNVTLREGATFTFRLTTFLSPIT